MKKTFFAVLLVSAISVMIFSACSKSARDSSSDTSPSRAGSSEDIKSVSFNDIKKNKTDWQKIYDEYIGSQSTDAAVGEEAGEQFKALSLDDQNSTINTSGSKTVSIKINDKSVAALLKNDWNPSALNAILGAYDNVFRMYRQYFNAGINVKVVDGKVANIVFNDKYSGNISNSIDMASTRAEIVNLLGKPKFENPDEELFGYKTDSFYIFFTGNNNISEISIYPGDTQDDNNALVAVISAFQKDKKNSSFTKLLKAKWPDFYLESGASSVEYLDYYLKGILVKFDMADQSIKIDVYNNFTGALTKDISLPDDINDSSSLDKDIFTIHQDRDSVFCSEQYRIAVNKYIRGDDSDNAYDLGMAFDNINDAVISPDKKQIAYIKSPTADDSYACIYILPQTKEKPDIELSSIQAMQAKWIDSVYLELSSDEINYIYDTQNNEIIPLPSVIFGTNFIITSINNNTVYYKK